MTDHITFIIELRPNGGPALPGLEALRRNFETAGPIAGLGEVTAVRVSLGSYRALLAAQTRRVQSIRAYCTKELAALDELERNRAA